MISVQLKCHVECRSNEDNWAGLSNAAKRRKLQNRLNQRAFRRRKAIEKRTEQESRCGSSDTTSTSASSPYQQAATVVQTRRQQHLQEELGSVDTYSFIQEQFSSTEMQFEPPNIPCAATLDPMTPNTWPYARPSHTNFTQVVPDNPMPSTMCWPGYLDNSSAGFIFCQETNRKPMGHAPGPTGVDEDAFSFQWPNGTSDEEDFEMWLNSTAWTPCEAVLWTAPQ